MPNHVTNELEFMCSKKALELNTYLEKKVQLKNQSRKIVTIGAKNA